MRLKWTLCLLLRDDHVLLLRRRKPPGVGLWNGVGGKLEPGESAAVACEREVLEETGYTVRGLRFAGIMTWDTFAEPESDHGIYLFVGEAQDGDPISTDEGDLGWLPIDFAASSADVVPWLRCMLPTLLADHGAWRHHFVFGDAGVEDYGRTPCRELSYRVTATR